MGTKKSGKTTTITNLIRELKRRNYRIAAVKHVSEPNFTIDTVGKDTWKFAESGANTIISLASNETATIEKVSLESVTLKDVLEKCEGNDLVFIEGLKKIVGQKKLPKIVVVKSRAEAIHALEHYKPILAFSGSYSTESLKCKIPYVNTFRDAKRLAGLIEEKILQKSE